jgi:hypothetical protein
LPNLSGGSSRLAAVIPCPTQTPEIRTIKTAQPPRARRILPSSPKQYGLLNIVILDGVVVQIDRTEKLRIRKRK